MKRRVARAGRADAAAAAGRPAAAKRGRVHEAPRAGQRVHGGRGGGIAAGGGPGQVDGAAVALVTPGGYYFNSQGFLLRRDG